MSDMQNFDYTGKDNLDIMSFANNYNNFLTELVESHAPKTGTLLDFGAGTGFFANRVAGTGRKLVCVEPDTLQADEIRTKGFDAFASSGDLADQSVDFSYSLNVLEHIEDDSAAMREIFRVLKPGSFCVIYVPAMPCLYSSMDEKVQHFRRYTRKELSGKLSNAGFDVMNCRYADILGVPATLAYKVIGSKSGDVSLKGLIAYDRVAFPVSKALDTITHRIAGKNVLAVARKPM
ncbi:MULTISPECIES: class I SAM-dependent methyltransferase [unclassified Thalassospira]|uniref:class I SAM-dependent methyltransferase n=1 Tax=unclassified Thalassospira TaxID=2648997 RepID=UPI001AFDFA08|nr:class I SAM-dependent methyltransferase [Thalassospira sp.]MBO6773500.1 class I SAM-dependent methyltransferase [Thalassospira sp.]